MIRGVPVAFIHYVTVSELFFFYGFWEMVVIFGSCRLVTRFWWVVLLAVRFGSGRLMVVVKAGFVCFLIGIALLALPLSLIICPCVVY